MTKSTITRERIQRIIRAINSEAYDEEEIREWLSSDEIMELSRMALAAMDGEPVAEVYQVPNVGICAALGPSIRMLCPLEPGTKLYRHPQPAPVAYSDFEEFWSAYIHPLAQDDELKDFAWDIWNACRAAMLAAAQHDTPALNPEQSVVTVPDKWIPVSEQMPPSRHEVLVGRWWGEKPRWCCKWATYIPGHPDAQSSGWLIPGASWAPTHWMPLPAGPQEVEGE